MDRNTAQLYFRDGYIYDEGYRTVKDPKTKVRWDKRIQIRRINVLLRGIPHVNSSRLYDNVILTTAEIATTPTDLLFPVARSRSSTKRRVIFIFTSAFAVLNAIARCLLLVTLNFPLISMCFTSTLSDASPFISRPSEIKFYIQRP